MTILITRSSTILLSRAFRTSSVLQQLPNHPLYSQLDWSKVEGGHYAIVDPMDTQGILYLSEKEYKIQVRVSVSQDSQLSVLARPGDSKLPSELASTASSPAKPTKTPPLKEELGLVLRKKDRSGITPFTGWPVSMFSGMRSDQLLVAPTGENLLSLILHWGLDLNIRSGGQIEPQPALNASLVELGKRLTNILLTRGRTALVLKMKNTLFFVNNWLAGRQNVDPFLLGEPVGLARSGLPRILPIYFRRALGSRNMRITRLVLSLLKSYSALEAPHPDNDLVSVTGKCPHLDQDMLKQFNLFCRDVFWPKVVRNYAQRADKMWVMDPDLRATPMGKPYNPVRGGPNHPVAILGAPMDAIAWDSVPINHAMRWAAHVKDYHTLSLFHQVLKLAKEGREIMSHEQSLVKRGLLSLPPLKRVKRWDFSREADLGRLAFLPEAAGKVRTIAIVDYWTQRLMKPVHDWMASVLSVLPTDGTFDQEAALRTYVSQTKEVKCHYSIDLKSATDMIPIDLYHALFSGIWGEETAGLWTVLLTDRAFRIPVETKDFCPLVVPNLRGTIQWYDRGQPMGTLSSWPSMALVHHALELFSAWRAGLDPVSFTAYRVLGDDNVTGNCLVAASYKDVCKALQIPISYSKTLEGKLFVFASQIYLGDENISPMSLKEELSVTTCSQRLEMALRAISRGWIGDKPTTARLLRLLLRRRDYLRSTKEFKVGKLGRVAQAALISAFALTRRSLTKLSGGKSTLVPFLLSLENKVRVLDGDENHLDRVTRSALEDIETILAISMMRSIVKRIKDDRDAILTAAWRWGEWKKHVKCSGLPLGVNSADELIFPSWDKPVKLPEGVELPHEASWRTYSNAVFPILEDYFGYWFEGTFSPGEAPPYILVSDEFVNSVNDGTVAYRELPSLNSADEGWTVVTSDPYEGGPLPGVPDLSKFIFIPRPCEAHDLVNELDAALATAEHLYKFLVRGNYKGDPCKGALSRVTQVLTLASYLPKFPPMEGLKSFYPDRTPKAVSATRQWVRQLQSYSEVLGHIQLARDFSVRGWTDSLPFDQEVLLTTSAETLNSVTRKEGMASVPQAG